jgi:hypothetical protein
MPGDFFELIDKLSHLSMPRFSIRALTTLVMYTLRRSMPASSSARSSDLPACATNGWPSIILPVAGLLANHHHLCSGVAFTENRLRRAFPYLATAALLCRFPQVAVRSFRPNEVGRQVVVPLRRHIGEESIWFVFPLILRTDSSRTHTECLENTD